MRIHHHTLKRLRAEIEPVAARDYLRFLFDWQHVSADARMTGPKALARVVAQLEGFEAPAAAWESDILPARLVGYESGWLDERCLAGQIAWMRLRTRNGRSGGKSAPVRSTPIALLLRRHARIWMSANSRDAAPHLSFRAQLIADRTEEHGASFFDELIDVTGLLRSQIEEGPAELVALGLATSDSFGGLRALLAPSSERRTGTHGRRRRRATAYGVEDAGRWAMVRRPVAVEREEDATEHVARTLLARYGVVFWRLLEREAARLPAWRELLRAYRRLDSRGEIRGGRFVAGFSGEQLALPEAIGGLRGARRRTRPINGCPCLARIPQPRRNSNAGAKATRVGWQPAAVPRRHSDGRVDCGQHFLETLDDAREWTAQKELLRGPDHAPSISPTGHDEIRRDAADEVIV